MPVQNKAAFWLRLQEPDLVLEADAEVWATTDGGEASSRKDVPVKLAPFDPDLASQKRWLASPARKRDVVHNLMFWDAPWSLGLGPNNTVQMIPDAPNEGNIWRFFNLTKLPDWGA